MQAKFVLNLLSYDEEGNKKISCTPRVFYEELNSHKFYRTKREKWDVAGVKNIGEWMCVCVIISQTFKFKVKLNFADEIISLVA